MMTALNFLIVFGAYNERQRASERDSEFYHYAIQSLPSTVPTTAIMTDNLQAAEVEPPPPPSIPKEVVLAFLLIFIPMLFFGNIIASILSWHFIETAIDDPTSAHIVAAVLAGLNQVAVLVTAAVFLWDVFGKDKQVKRARERNQDLEAWGEKRGDRGG